LKFYGCPSHSSISPSGGGKGKGYSAKGEISMGETKDALKEIIPILNNNPRSADLMGAFTRVIQFDLDGEKGKFLMTVRKGRMALPKTVSKKVDIVVSGDTKEFAKVVRGEIDVTHPIARGQLIIKKGKVSEMTLLNRILWVIKGR
jgi:putative sterol carrier protein